ncbi:MAG: AAA family ATPase [Bacteroidales bacterium]|nr:AAA family ATPase [Bacteroidales bacterium]
MIQRALLQQLKKWKESEDRKPLILRGARQVGKSTLVEMFSHEFDVYLHLNLDEEADRMIFEKNKNIDTLINTIYVHCLCKKSDKPSLLFIDEIQNSPSAVAMLRYFYEKAPWLYVIAAGSLLESLIGSHISFPVGRVQYLALRPCSFMEFLDGTNQTFDKQLIENLQADMAHERIMESFKNYCVVGGMPAAVTKYSQKMDVLAADEIYETLITSYSDDVEKYASNNNMAMILRFIISNGWKLGGETITFEHFANSPYKTREMSEAFKTIEKSMLLELAYPVVSAEMPLLPAFTRRPKLLWLDTGIINYAAQIRKEVFSVDNIQDVWRGRIAEHIVAQELISHDHKVSTKRNFWVNPKNGSSSEIDFVYPFEGKCIPIEVKSGVNAHLKSLQIFMDNCPHQIAIRVWSKPLEINDLQTPSGKKFKLINIPFYYVGILEKILEKEC